MLLLLIFIHSSFYLRIPSLQIRQTSASKKNSGYGSTNTRTKMARLEPSSFKDEFRVEAMQTRASYVSACLSDEISRIRRTFRDLYPIVHCGHIFVLFPSTPGENEIFLRSTVFGTLYSEGTLP